MSEQGFEVLLHVAAGLFAVELLVVMVVTFCREERWLDPEDEDDREDWEGRV